MFTKMFKKKNDSVNEGLNLKDFISQSLDDICEAVKTSRETHPFIAPQFFTDPSNTEKATNVNFDIAVTVGSQNNQSRNLGAEGGAKMQIAVVNASAKISENTKKEKNSSYSKISRITFSVPIYFQLDEKRRLEILAEIEKQKAEHNSKKPAKDGRI